MTDETTNVPAPPHHRTGRAGAGGLRPRARLHGDVGVLRHRRRGRGAGHHRPGARPRRDLPRHRRHVRPRSQREAARPRDRGPPRRGRAGHQVRQRAPRGRHPAWASTAARVRPLGLRRLAAAARRRPHRPLLPAPRRPRRPDRGDRRRDGRARRGRQGAPPRAVRGRRGHDPPRARDAPDHRAADRVLAVDARLEDAILPCCASSGSGSSRTRRSAAASSPGAIDRSLPTPTTSAAALPRFQGDTSRPTCVSSTRSRDRRRRRACTPGQLALAWVLAQGDDVVPIPAPSGRYLEENVAALDVAAVRRRPGRARRGRAARRGGRASATPTCRASTADRPVVPGHPQAGSWSLAARHRASGRRPQETRRTTCRE